MGQYRDKEKSVYDKIDGFKELKTDVEKLEKTLTDYNKAQAEKQENK